MQKVSFTPWIVFSVGLLWLGGCATIISGTNQPITFNSNPDGAKILIDGTPMGFTPATLQLKRKSGQTLAFEKEGFQTASLPLQTTVNPWFLGNVLIGGLIGTTTDGISGAIIQYSPNQFMVSLESSGESELGGRVTTSRAEKVREYIVSSYDSLVSNLSEGHGEYLTSLLSLLEISEERKEEAIETLRRISEGVNDVVQFADEVVREYIN